MPVLQFEKAGTTMKWQVEGSRVIEMNSRRLFCSFGRPEVLEMNSQRLFCSFGKPEVLEMASREVGFAVSEGRKCLKWRVERPEVLEMASREAGGA